MVAPEDLASSQRLTSFQLIASSVEHFHCSMEKDWLRIIDVVYLFAFRINFLNISASKEEYYLSQSRFPKA